MTKDDLITIVEHYVPKKQDRDSVLSAVWDYSEALIAAKPYVSGSLGFDEGYSKGYSDATKEARQEIREHYHPNDR